MKKDELARILIELQCAYPLFYSNKIQKDFGLIGSVWMKHIGMFSAETVQRAVDLMIDKETEVPTIALVLRYIPEAQKALAREREWKQLDDETRRRLAR